MLDNELITLIISIIVGQEAIAGIPGTPIQQAFQPTQQGVNTNPTGYLYKLYDERLGSRGVTDTWVPDPDPNPTGTGVMVHTETQAYLTTFQIGVLATQNPKTPLQKTASDIVNLIAYILQSEATMEKLREAGIGILKVGQVENTPFMDDRARNEFYPTFQFTISHKQIVTSTMPVIQSTEFQILSV